MQSAKHAVCKTVPARGSWLDTSRRHQYRGVYQWLDYEPHKLDVVGSNPIPAPKLIRRHSLTVEYRLVRAKVRVRLSVALPYMRSWLNG